MMYLTANLKSHITISVMANAILELLPIKPSMTFPMKYSLMTLSFFRSCWLRRKYNTKVGVHTCCATCHPAPDKLANKNSLPDNDDTALASMKSRGEQVTTKDAALWILVTLQWSRKHTKWWAPWGPLKNLGHRWSPVEQIQMTSPKTL